MIYERYFDMTNSFEWDPNNDYNKVFVYGTLSRVADKIKHKGYYTIYDLENDLGIVTEPKYLIQFISFGWTEADLNEKGEIWDKITLIRYDDPKAIDSKILIRAFPSKISTEVKS